MPTANTTTNYVDDVFDVHKKVLSGFHYVSDEIHHPESIDDWRIPEDCERVTGDCDDFAIACRVLLREKGYESRLLFCLTENDGGHLICMLGKMALDNRQPRPIEVESLVRHIGYTLISVSGWNPGDEWRKIKGLNDGGMRLNDDYN